VSPAVAAAPLEVAERVAGRMADPAEVRETVCAPGNLGLLDEAHPWGPASLSHGYPGTILLFGELDRRAPERGWDALAKRHVVEMLAAIEEAGLRSPALFGGAAGVGLALWSVSRGGTRYARVAAKVNQALVGLGERLLDEAATLEGGTAMGAYDVVEGASGIVRYLLLLPDEGQVAALRMRLLEYLVSLARPVPVDGHSVPGWFVPRQRQFTAEDVEQFPRGNFNCGLAHGIPGPLAALSIGYLQRVRIEGHLAAIGQFAGWLVAAHGEDEAGPFWPARVAFEALGSKPAAPESTRTAWCYGSPGIARALFLAGRALGDEPLCELALRAARALVPAGGAGPGLESPTVCHGQAGMLQFLLRMAWDTGDGRLARGAANLSAQLAAGFDESAPFGYRDVERDGERAIALDKAGVLTGAAGVGLALASAGGGRAPVWDHALLFA
jgi:hypothetical protein